MILGALSFLFPSAGSPGYACAGQEPEPMRRRDPSDGLASGERPGRQELGGTKTARPPAQETKSQKGRGWPSRRRADGRLADQPVPAPPLRGLQLAELAGDPQQPSVRGRGRHGDGLELRRVGRGRGGSRSPRQSRSSGTGSRPPWQPGLTPRRPDRLVAAVVSCPVGSGQFYRLTGEGRTIGWGEEPLWFPHEAAKFAGAPACPTGS